MRSVGYVLGMTTFVIETYLSRHRRGGLDRAVVELRRAAAVASAGDARVRHIRSFYVEADEIAYHLVEGTSIELVTLVGRTAGLKPDRIVRAETR